MFARTRPRSNAGQLKNGPKLVTRVLPSPKSEDDGDKYPTDPNSETRGKRSATATPTRAVSACNAYSAKRTSARLRSNPAGSPMSRTCGRGGSSASDASACANAAGDSPSSTARRCEPLLMSRSSGGMLASVVSSWARARAMSRSVPRPPASNACVSSNVCCWFSALRCATDSRYRAPLSSKYVRASSAETITNVSRSASVAALASAVAACTERRTRPKKSSSHTASRVKSYSRCSRSGRAETAALSSRSSALNCDVAIG